MLEQIGKIILDKKYYPGVDLYCDGIIEDEILDIVQNNESGEYRKIIEERASWPIFYHLSSLRENIVEWLPIDKNAKVLEVGSGCGAITGALARKAGSVTCIDLSRKRSLINAYRHQDMDNIYIHVGNFKDVEKDLPCDYDYVMLIGVFEYGQGYMDSDTPYEDFMNILKKHLKPGSGRMVIAIENKLGLKYFAGCKEDHSGRYFDGIEDYSSNKGIARTFSKKGLEKILEQCGIGEYSFYYPYPDYKFPNVLFSDRKLPKVGELYQNIRNFDRERVLLFDEQKAFDMIIREDMFPQYSNSYMIVTGPVFETEYVKYSNDRAPEFAIRTDIVKKGTERFVVKHRMSQAGEMHINNMLESAKELASVYEKTGLSVNRCEEKEGVFFEFVEGVTLEEKLDECLSQNKKEEFLALVERYRNILLNVSDNDVADYDLIFQNIMVNGDKWTVIDYEWTFPCRISADIMFRRALYCYFAERNTRDKAKEWIEDHYSDEMLLSGEKWEQVLQAEQKFQKYVQGEYMAASEVRHAIGNPVYSLDYLLDCIGSRENIQIYEDCGKGFSETESYIVDKVRRIGTRLIFDIKLKQDLINVRIDPANRPCILNIVSVSADGKEIVTELTAKGRNGKGAHNGVRLSETAFFFADGDPHFKWNVEKLVRQGKQSLRVEMEIEFITAESAACLHKGLRVKKKLESGR